MHTKNRHQQPADHAVRAYWCHREHYVTWAPVVVQGTSWKLCLCRLTTPIINMSQFIRGELRLQDRKLGADGRGSEMANTVRAGRVQRRRKEMGCQGEWARAESHSYNIWKQLHALVSKSTLGACTLPSALTHMLPCSTKPFHSELCVTWMPHRMQIS